MRSPVSKSTAAPSVTVEEAQAAPDSPRWLCGQIVLDLEKCYRRIEILNESAHEDPVRFAAYRAGAIPGSPVTAIWEAARSAVNDDNSVDFSQWVEFFREAADATPESRFKDWCKIHLDCAPPIDDAGSPDANIEAAAPLIEADDYKAAWCHLGLALRDLDPDIYPNKFASGLARLLFCVDGMDEEGASGIRVADFIREDVRAALEEHLIPRLDEQQRRSRSTNSALSVTSHRGYRIRSRCGLEPGGLP